MGWADGRLWPSCDDVLLETGAPVHHRYLGDVPFYRCLGSILGNSWKDRVCLMEAQYAKNSNLAAADMNGETVMLDLASGQYYGIGGVGSRLWELLSKPATKTSLVSAICSEYDVEPCDCEGDIAAFLDSLLAQGLIAEIPQGS